MYNYSVKKGELISKKRGQLTLFVFIAILLIVFIFSYFYFVAPDFFGTSTRGINFESCTNDVILEGINELGLIGATKDPSYFYLYQDERIPYYCYTNLPYQTCVVQRPLVKKFFEEELEKHVKDRVQLCYENSLEELTNLGYNVTSGDVQYNFTIIPNRINVEISAPTTVGNQRFTDYRMFVDTQIYDILILATSILQHEAKYGDSSTGELMFYYPDLIIDKLKQSDSTTLYIIQDKHSETKFQFASRSLIWPAGYDVVEQ